MAYRHTCFAALAVVPVAELLAAVLAAEHTAVAECIAALAYSLTRNHYYFTCNLHSFNSLFLIYFFDYFGVNFALSIYHSSPTLYRFLKSSGNLV